MIPEKHCTDGLQGQAKAVQLIEEAGISNETTLDLSRYGLTECPEKIRELTSLKSLNLWGNWRTWRR